MRIIKRSAANIIFAACLLTLLSEAHIIIQFYLPIQKQRISIDIDMIFAGSKHGIDDVLKSISKSFGSKNGLFEFIEYKPKNPKTSLSLYTYKVEIPSVFDEDTLRVGGSY